jgi:hypothetical protein
MASPAAAAIRRALRTTFALRPVIAEAHTNGLPLAENAINELSEGTPWKVFGRL